VNGDVGARCGARAWLRDLPGQLRDVRTDARQLGGSVKDLWPLVWRTNADREVEFFSQQAFDAGREFGRQQLAAETPPNPQQDDSEAD
jgi:hypothetical protein